MLKNYIKIAWKVLLRRKFFTFVSLFGIVFTLMILMVAAALINHMMFPVKSGSKLGRCLHAMRIDVEGENTHIVSFPSYYFFDHYIKSMKRPEAISINTNTSTTATYVRSRKLEFQLKYTDEIFWDIMAMDFVAGQPYDQSMVANADRVAVITDRAARQIFGKEPAVGKYIEITEGSFRVIGVVPRENIPFYSMYSDIYAPITTSQTTMDNTRLFGRCTAFLLAGDKSDFDGIRKEYAARLDQALEDNKGKFHTILSPVFSQSDFLAMYIFGFDSDYSNTLALLGILLLAVLFMLFPAINLINMNISRIIERSSEIGVRKAFGASPTTLVGQFLVENIILTLIGGAIAYLASLGILHMITQSGLIPYGHFGIDIRVFIYCLVLALFFGLFSGVLPAYRMSRLNPVDALKGIEA